MTVKIKDVNKFQPKFGKIATKMVEDYEAGIIPCEFSRLGYKVLKIGQLLRVVKKSDSKGWVLMSHEKYNKYLNH